MGTAKQKQLDVAGWTSIQGEHGVEGASFKSSGKDPRPDYTEHEAASHRFIQVEYQGKAGLRSDLLKH